MKKIVVVVAVGLLVMLGSGRASGQQGYDLFQQALVKERAEGDLEGAIGLYRRIVNEHADDRVLVAEALVQIGRSYEKMEWPDAVDAYRRVVEEYADQADSRRFALERLAALSALPGRDTFEVLADDPTFTLLREEFRRGDDPISFNYAGHFDFSPTGEHYVFRHPGSEQMPAGLYISDIGNTYTSALVTEDTGPGGLVNLVSPRWSPDGDTIAFLAAGARTVWTQKVRIYVVPAEGGSPRQIGEPLTIPAGGCLLWTRDSKRLTYPYRHESVHPSAEDWRIGTRDLDGRTVDILHRPAVTEIFGSGYSISYPRDYSPDGKWLMLDTRISGGSDIWLMSAEGGTEAVRLTKSKNNGQATWTRDGETIFFVSTRTGIRNLWKLEIDPASGRPRGAPTQATFYTNVEVYYPGVITDEDGVAFLLSTFTSTIYLARAQEQEALRHPLSVRGHSPALSPDGSLLYYQGEVPDRSVFVLPVSGGAPRSLPIASPRGRYYNLSPDGEYIAYVHTGEDGDGRGMFINPTSGGPARRLATADISGLAWPSWSPDSSKLAYSDGSSLWIVATVGGVPERIAALPEGFNSWGVGSVRWSPDGRHVAAKAGGEYQAAFVVSSSGGDPRQLTPPEENGQDGRTWAFGWHPDGDRLTYLMRGPIPGITENDTVVRAAYLDGSSPTTLIDAPGLQHYEWHQDAMVFWALDPDGSGLTAAYRVDPATGDAIRFGGLQPAGRLAWRTDEGTTAWVAQEEISQLWLMEESR